MKGQIKGPGPIQGLGWALALSWKAGSGKQTLIYTSHVLRERRFSFFLSQKNTHPQKTSFWDDFKRGIRYQDLLRLVIWSRMH